VSILGYEDLYASITHSENVPPEYWLTIDPFDIDILQPASFELAVGNSFARFRHGGLGGAMLSQMGPKRLSDLDERDYEVTANLGLGDEILVSPGEMIILATDRYVMVPKGLGLFVQGKSSVGRKAQLIHMAGFVDPEFEGVIMLEPCNFAPFPVIYTVGEPICQVTATTLLHPTQHGYGTAELGSRYKGQRIAQPPKRSQRMFMGQGVMT
jgi:dCTP deaminase